MSAARIPAEIFGWKDYAALVEQRGFVVLYRRAEPNHCPGCGRSQWLVGRSTAECANCGTALPIIQSASSDISIERKD